MTLRRLTGLSRLTRLGIFHQKYVTGHKTPQLMTACILLTFAL